MKAHYCEYTELMFCSSCFGKERRILPWRAVHLLDFEARRCVRVSTSVLRFGSCAFSVHVVFRSVSTSASEFLDTVVKLPTVDMRVHAPEALNTRPELVQATQIRAAIIQLKASW